MSELYHPLDIGNLHLEGNVFLAPLAGYTDKVFRSICISHGADLCYTEMVSCEGVYRCGQKTIDLMNKADNEKNLAVQLFAPDAETTARSIPQTMKSNPSLLDFNCGCPVPKVTKTGAGSSLLKTPEEIGKIVSVMKKESGLPVSVKIRAGWDCNSINYRETAIAAFQAGADSLCMHARTKSQLYMPFATWNWLKDLKNAFPDKIIIGSGDLFTAEDAKKMLEETGIDGVAFARGAIGNPFVFEQAKAVLLGKHPEKPSVEMIVNEILNQLEGMKEMLGENTACREMRKHVCAYLKGIAGSSKVKNMISTALTVDDYKKALDYIRPM